MSVASPPQPFTLLIAALGGEGGGVMTGWIVAAARAAGLWVQATSIPGVAQRTGATTYYIEIWPEPLHDAAHRPPVLSLSPARGEVDVLVASELLEAGRAIKAGLVTPDRTLLIASTHRVLTTREKMDTGDGRFDADQLRAAANERARCAILVDMEEAARSVGASLNAVMLGVLAGAGCLPIDNDALRRSVGADGRATESNLAGFDAGLRSRPPAQVARSAKDGQPDQADMLEEFPSHIRPDIARALARLTDYQDAAYANLYQQRLSAFRDGDPALLRSVARHLAIRMSYEDSIRVAQAKLRPGRLDRIRKSAGAGDGDILVVTDFFKPGITEICDILPDRLGQLLAVQGERRSWLRNFSKPVKLSPTNLWGYVRLRFIANLRRFRPASRRYRAEQAWIDNWLRTIGQAATVDVALAVEISECAQLVKGYGDTHRRSLVRYQEVVGALLRPALPEQGEVCRASSETADPAES